MIIVLQFLLLLSSLLSTTAAPTTPRSTTPPTTTITTLNDHGEFFNYLDQDNSKVITSGELTNYFSGKYSLSPTDLNLLVTDIVQRHDSDGDLIINIDEFASNAPMVASRSRPSSILSFEPSQQHASPIDDANGQKNNTLSQFKLRLMPGPVIPPQPLQQPQQPQHEPSSQQSRLDTPNSNNLTPQHVIRVGIDDKFGHDEHYEQFDAPITTLAVTLRSSSPHARKNHDPASATTTLNNCSTPQEQHNQSTGPNSTINIPTCQTQLHDSSHCNSLSTSINRHICQNGYNSRLDQVRLIESKLKRLPTTRQWNKPTPYFNQRDKRHIIYQPSSLEGDINHFINTMATIATMTTSTANDQAEKLTILKPIVEFSTSINPKSSSSTISSPLRRISTP